MRPASLGLPRWLLVQLAPKPLLGTRVGPAARDRPPRRAHGAPHHPWLNRQGCRCTTSTSPALDPQAPMPAAAVTSATVLAQAREVLVAKESAVPKASTLVAVRGGGLLYDQPGYAGEGLGGALPVHASCRSRSPSAPQQCHVPFRFHTGACMCTNI